MNALTGRVHERGEPDRAPSFRTFARMGDVNALAGRVNERGESDRAPSFPDQALAAHTNESMVEASRLPESDRRLPEWNFGRSGCTITPADRANARGESDRAP